MAGKKGMKHYSRELKERRGLSTAVGLTLSGKIYKRHFGGSMKSAQVVTMLNHLQRHVPGPLILIWDRASIHKSRETRRYLDAHPEIRIDIACVCTGTQS